MAVAFVDRWHPDNVVKMLYAPESTGECHAPSSGHPLLESVIGARHLATMLLCS